MKFKDWILSIKMTETCEYCNNNLSTKSNLVFHQKNNKKCLEIQKNKSVNINSNLKQCEFCDKEFSSNIIKRHLSLCNQKKEKELEDKILHLENKILDLQKEYQDKILDLEKGYQNKILELEKELENKEKIITEKDNKISELENKISELHELNIKLQTENNIYQKDHQIIANMAQQPKTTTNTNNHITNNLAVYDNKLITDRFTNALSNITPMDLYDGQESISRLIAPCLKNDDGTQLYKCTDYSRGVYVTKDKNGNIVKDINGKNLVERIEPIASKKAVELLEENTTKRDKQRKIKYLKKHIENEYEEIESLKQHIKGYEINSSSWKYHNDRLKNMENTIERCLQEQEDLENEVEYETDSVEMCDEKLTDGVHDIKNMKKDSTKFSRKLSKLLT